MDKNISEFMNATIPSIMRLLNHFIDVEKIKKYGYSGKTLFKMLTRYFQYLDDGYTLETMDSHYIPQQKIIDDVKNQYQCENYEFELWKIMQRKSTNYDQIDDIYCDIQKIDDSDKMDAELSQTYLDGLALYRETNPNFNLCLSNHKEHLRFYKMLGDYVLQKYTEIYERVSKENNQNKSDVDANIAKEDKNIKIIVVKSTDEIVINGNKLNL